MNTTRVRTRCSALPPRGRRARRPDDCAPRFPPLRPPPSAFTLVELLVVITIIGVLVGLLLPAVQAARESARRMQCSNNLKQTMLAVHSYHEAQGAFPIGAAETGSPEFTCVSWMMAVLPHLEMINVYNEFDLAALWPDCMNGAAAAAYRTKIPTYCCPSDNAGVEGYYDKRQNGGPGFARSNVVGCFSADGCFEFPVIVHGVLTLVMPTGTPRQRADNRHLERGNLACQAPPQEFSRILAFGGQAIGLDWMAREAYFPAL